MISKKKKGLIIPARFSFLQLLIQKDANFIWLIAICILIAGISYPFPHIAMWFGFVLAAYSSTANDSIQTIGTFISSNNSRPWWHLWLFIGVLFLGTVLTSWLLYDGDVTFQRLSSKGFSQAPTSFHFLQIAAPIFLLIITRLKVPVSTTFLLLSAFSASPGAVLEGFEKSVFGYLIAFITAVLVWTALDRWMKNWFQGHIKTRWVVFQWITSGLLWVLWIIQDAANIAVYLPRKLDLIQFLVFSLTVFLGLGLIFYLKGDKIQQIVDEKTDTKDIRKATMIDLVYGFILILFSWINTIPMSTTWVFIGLLGGREIAIKYKKEKALGATWKLIGKDLLHALIGLVVSIVIAVASNEKLREEILRMMNL